MQTVNMLQSVLIDNVHLLTQQRELIPLLLKYEGKIFCVLCPGFRVQNLETVVS